MGSPKGRYRARDPYAGKHFERRFEAGIVQGAECRRLWAGPTSETGGLRAIAGPAASAPVPPASGTGGARPSGRGGDSRNSAARPLAPRLGRPKLHGGCRSHPEPPIPEDRAHGYSGRSGGRLGGIRSRRIACNARTSISRGVGVSPVSDFRRWNSTCRRGRIPARSWMALLSHSAKSWLPSPDSLFQYGDEPERERVRGVRPEPEVGDSWMEFQHLLERGRGGNRRAWGWPGSSRVSVRSASSRYVSSRVV